MGSEAIATILRSFLRREITVVRDIGKDIPVPLVVGCRVGDRSGAGAERVQKEDTTTYT